ncbi:MAG: GNAT family N-acetyltransferase [Pirellulales bacterium]
MLHHATTHSLPRAPITVGVVSPPSETRLVALDWESEHFGFSVARLDADGLGDARVWAELAAARHRGVRLVVLTTVPERLVPPDLLMEFQGTLVDRKATFARALAAGPTSLSVNDTDGVAEYQETTVSDALAALALSAGAYSRFQLDPRFPRQHFEAMYRLWIERSVRHEIASAVLVVRAADLPDGLAGLVTVSVADGTGKIGLIAVAEPARGHGVGRRLVAAAHRWMQHNGARRAEVVTQLANAPACALYQRSGYSLARVEHYYHLWPLAD